MKLIFTIFITLILSINIFSQQKNLDINQIKLSEYLKSEKKYIGGKILNDKVTDLYDELTHISYIRSDASIPDTDLIVRYIFFKKDSLILEIRYEWDIANQNEKINNKKDADFRKRMASFYSKLEKKYLFNFGNSKTNGNLPNNINAKNDYYKTNIWELNNTIIKLEIKMSNLYDKTKNIYPTHKAILSYRATNIKNKDRYFDKPLLKYERKEISNIKNPLKNENPIIGERFPVFPDCEKSKNKTHCLYGNIQELIINKMKSKNILIKDDTLKVGFVVDKTGIIKPYKFSIKSNKNNQELEKIAFEVLKKLPRMKPEYFNIMKQNVTTGHSFYLIIKNNEIVNKFNKE